MKKLLAFSLLLVITSIAIPMPYNIIPLVEAENNKIDRYLVFLNYYSDKYHTTQDIIHHVYETSVDLQLDFHILVSLISNESSFIEVAKSRVGAYGYMQLRPIAMRDIKRQDLDIYNKYDNITAGSIFLKKLISRFDGDIMEALIYYNTGTKLSNRPKGISYARRILRNAEKLDEVYDLNTQVVF